jgi:hypothetical protein
LFSRSMRRNVSSLRPVKFRLCGHSVTVKRPREDRRVGSAGGSGPRRRGRILGGVDRRCGSSWECIDGGPTADERLRVRRQRSPRDSHRGRRGHRAVRRRQRRQHRRDPSLPGFGRALDVGEEEGERACRQAILHAPRVRLRS